MSRQNPVSLSEFGGYVLQYAYANPDAFARISRLHRNEPEGFALFRHAAGCMTIFYPEVKCNLTSLRRCNSTPYKKLY